MYIYAVYKFFVIIIQGPNFEFYVKGANISSKNIYMECI